MRGEGRGERGEGRGERGEGRGERGEKGREGRKDLRTTTNTSLVSSVQHPR